jgi:hypothetical protein
MWQGVKYVSNQKMSPSTVSYLLTFTLYVAVKSKSFTVTLFKSISYNKNIIFYNFIIKRFLNLDYTNIQQESLLTCAFLITSTKGSRRTHFLMGLISTPYTFDQKLNLSFLYWLSSIDATYITALSGNIFQHIFKEIFY